jgi:ABC-type transport system substrate-binding protein
MKGKLFLISLLVIFSLILGACTPEVEEAIEETATDVQEAVEEVVEEVQEELEETEEAVVEETEEEEVVEEEETAEPMTTLNSDERYPKITIGVAADPQDLSPWDWNAGSHPYIFQNFYETLFDFVDNDYVPLLAKSYSVVDDLHYNVELYDYIYDHAGNHITADDVVYAITYYVDNGHAVKYDMFGSVAKVDDYTVEFTWTRPINRVGDLEHPWCRTPIYDLEAFEAGNFATNPIGTGAYKVVDFVSGSKVVLEANDDYWQTDETKISDRHQQNVQTIEYDVIAERSQHVIGLQTGAINVSELVPVENLSDFQEGGEFADQYDVLQTIGSQFYAFLHNMFEGKIGSDKNFRLATFYAIDNQAVATATGGLIFGSKAYGTPHFPDFVESWMDEPNYINTYDPELAKEYLEKTAYDGEVLKFVAPVEEPVKTMATVIQALLENVGIKSEMELMEGKAMGPLFTDPESYDIMITQHGGGSQIGEWNRALNFNELGNDKSYGFIHDETLQELFLTASNAATHNESTMTALHSYILDQAYHYAIGSPIINMVHTSDMFDLVFRENEFLLPGGCQYYLD